MLNIYIVIPAHNEEAFLAKTLRSLCEQTVLPKKLVVVNDNSTDETQNIIDTFALEHTFITGVSGISESKHLPGAKVVEAFYKGMETVDENFDVICKFDADLVFPEDYLQKISEVFIQNKNCGIAGGHCYIQKNENWVIEGLTNKDHIRGALKAYRKACFSQIGGLKRTMGWDTVDELLTQYHGWEVCTLDNLHVKHLKPTGATYDGIAGMKQGQAFKKMRYGFLLTVIASVKLGWKKRSLAYVWNCLRGYFSIKNDYIVTPSEGKFIRKLRWNKIRKKFL